MAKGGGDVRDRLQRAALELFRERGYDRTTAVEIAARAGVTERTFFRHFPDKREVLFQGEDVLRIALTGSIAEVDGRARPVDLLFRAFRSVLPMLRGNRPFAEPRQGIIAMTPALRERELAKHAALADSLAEALQARGVPDLTAALAARTAMEAFVHAVDSWIDDPEPGLDERLDRARREMQALWGDIDP